MLLHPFVDGLTVAAPLQRAAKTGAGECPSTAQAHQPRKRHGIVICDIADRHDFGDVQDTSLLSYVCQSFVIVVRCRDGHAVPPLLVLSACLLGNDDNIMTIFVAVYPPLHGYFYPPVWASEAIKKPP